MGAVERFDLVVVGGGPAGLGTALAAVRRGMRCLVVDRGHWPIDKACGEGVLPRGVDRLRELGVELPADSVPLEGVRYVEDGTEVEARFAGTQGRGVRRVALSGALRARALECGATLWHRTAAGGWTEGPEGIRLETTRGPVRSSWLVGADGLSSAVRERTGIRVRRGAARFGVRRHYRCRPWTRHVEVHWTAGLEAYVTPVGPECVDVALLGRDCGGGPDALLERFPALRSRLGPPASRPMGAGPFAVRAVRRTRGRVALVGDAAGYVDPITGEGVALALSAAESLADALAAGRPERYDRAWPALTRRHRALTRVVLLLASRPALRRRVLDELASRPHAFAQLLAFATHAEACPGLLAVTLLLGRTVLSGAGRTLTARLRPSPTA